MGGFLPMNFDGNKRLRRVGQTKKKELASHLSDGWSGQLPVLNDGDRWMSQSMAITRYVSKKWGLEGDNLKDFAISELLIEESNDLFTSLTQFGFGLPKFSEQLPKLSKQLDY